jgi:hypothetical protein
MGSTMPKARMDLFDLLILYVAQCQRFARVVFCRVKLIELHVADFHNNNSL